MDATTLAVTLVIIIFALIVTAAFLVFRQRGRVNIKGPMGTGLELDASNDPPPSQPGVEGKRIKTKGGVRADDHTGRGATLEDVDAGDDVLLSSSPPPGPKADPPA